MQTTDTHKDYIVHISTNLVYRSGLPFSIVKLNFERQIWMNLECSVVVHAKVRSTDTTTATCSSTFSFIYNFWKTFALHALLMEVIFEGREMHTIVREIHDTVNIQFTRMKNRTMILAVGWEKWSRFHQTEASSNIASGSKCIKQQTSITIAGTIIVWLWQKTFHVRKQPGTCFNSPGLRMELQLSWSSSHTVEVHIKFLHKWAKQNVLLRMSVSVLAKEHARIYILPMFTMFIISI